MKLISPRSTMKKRSKFYRFVSRVWRGPVWGPETQHLDPSACHSKQPLQQGSIVHGVPERSPGLAHTLACTHLQATVHGLSVEEAEKRLKEYGPNKLPEQSRNPILVFLGYMWNPLAWAMEVAAILAIALLDYADFALIVALLLVNSTISYIEESNADKAIKVWNKL